MSEAEIIWEDPPPSGRGKSIGKYTHFADAMRANPGRWMKFPEGTPISIRSAIKRRTCTGFETGIFEATIRKDVGIFARYVGPDEAVAS